MPNCRIALDRKLSDALDRGQVNLGPMIESEVRSVIEEPARRVGLDLEPGLVDKILRDVSQQPGSLPLLEYVLTSMWSLSAGVLSAALYKEAGGVANSIGKSAESIYEGFRSEEERQACQNLASRLVHVTAAEAEGGDTRQIVRRSDLTPQEWANRGTIRCPR